MMGQPVRRRGCKRCKGKGTLDVFSRRSKRVANPAGGEVIIPDKVACPDCCLHNVPPRMTPEPMQPNAHGTPASSSRVNCGRCGAFMERRPIAAQGNAPSQTAITALRPAQATLPGVDMGEPRSGAHRASKRRRKLARTARAPSKPGLPSDPSHLVLHFGHVWDDTVGATIRWKMPSDTMEGMNFGLDLDRPLNMKDGSGVSKTGTFTVIHVKPDGSVHPPWVRIMEGL